MTTPDESQQVRHDDLETALSEQYDALEAAEEQKLEAVADEEVEVLEEEDQEAPEAAEAEEQLEAEAEETEELTEEEEEAALEAEPEYDKPAPERWPQDWRDNYGNMTPQQKQILMETHEGMQRQYTQNTQEISKLRSRLDPMLEALNQNREVFERAGVDPATAFRQQMAWTAHISRVGPEQGLRDMMQSYGVQNLKGQEAADEPYLTPVERAMKTRLDNLEGGQQQQNLQQNQQQQFQQQQAYQAREAAVSSGLVAFANETRDGKPTHPHVEKVAQSMAGLIKGGLVQRVDEYGRELPVDQQLGQAYELACNQMKLTHPGEQRAQRRQVKRAVAANREVVGKTAANASTPVDEPLGQTIERIYDQMDRSATR